MPSRVQTGQCHVKGVGTIWYQLIIINNSFILTVQKYFCIRPPHHFPLINPPSSLQPPPLPLFVRERIFSQGWSSYPYSTPSLQPEILYPAGVLHHFVGKSTVPPPGSLTYYTQEGCYITSSETLSTFPTHSSLLHSSHIVAEYVIGTKLLQTLLRVAQSVGNSAVLYVICSSDHLLLVRATPNVILHYMLCPLHVVGTLLV